MGTQVKGLLLLAFLVSSTHVMAQSTAGPTCVLYDSAYEKAPLFEVTGPEPTTRVYFYDKAEACPGDTACPSRNKAYLIPGDVVFAGPEAQGFRCAYYGIAKGNLMAGFLPASSLKPHKEEKAIDSKFIQGEWSDGTTTISITPVSGDVVKAEGNSVWQGMGDNIHVGEFSATATAKGEQIVFSEGEDEYDCKVTLRRRGPYVIAEDNGYCGGANVRFAGILVRKRK